MAKAVMNQRLQKSRDRRFQAPTGHEKQPQQQRHLDQVDDRGHLRAGLRASSLVRGLGNAFERVNEVGQARGQ